jgi:hypothetical protein
MKLSKLAVFLVKAKKKTYAGEGKEIRPQRPGFKELEYKEGDFYYRDSYSGFYQAPGQEVVCFRGEPVWAMAYSGGMRKEFHGNETLAEETFGFLKKCLLQVPKSEPFRGPREYSEGNFSYQMELEGDINDFSGEERILHKGKEVFHQSFIGGMIIQK